LDSKTFHKSVSDEEWLKALGKDDEEPVDYKYELYTKICENYKIWENANRDNQKAFSHQFVETKESKTYLNLFDEMKAIELSSPTRDEKENTLYRFRKSSPKDRNEQKDHYSSNDSMRPLRESSPEIIYMRDPRPQNVPIFKLNLTPVNLCVPYDSEELREALWGNSDETWSDDRTFPLYEQICEAYKQYNRHFKSAPDVQKDEQAEPGQQGKENASSNYTINVRNILQNSDDEVEFIFV
uniref:DUF4706 domain-containing protein n=1 Tax=Rodentolepis nana TaxID=102285 RepID=A0A0R3U073_RODNA